MALRLARFHPLKISWPNLLAAATKAAAILEEYPYQDFSIIIRDLLNAIPNRPSSAAVPVHTYSDDRCTSTNNLNNTVNTVSLDQTPNQQHTDCPPMDAQSSKHLGTEGTASIALSEGSVHELIPHSTDFLDQSPQDNDQRYAVLSPATMAWILDFESMPTSLFHADHEAIRSFDSIIPPLPA